MYKDKNYGLPKDLLETVKSVVLENKIESEFKKYLDENFHVEQLTEEEIQWIFENEFVQLNEGLGLALRGAYEVGKRLLPRIFKGGSKAGPRRIPGPSSPKSNTGVGSGGRTGPSGGNKKPSFDQIRRTAQTLKTPGEIAKTRKAMVAAGAAGAGGAIGAALNSTKNDGPGSASAGMPPKTGPASGSFRAAQETGMPPKTGPASGSFRAAQETGMPPEKEATPKETPAATAAKPAAKPAARTRRPRPSRSSGGESWAQRQHSRYSTGRSSIFTPES